MMPHDNNNRNAFIFAEGNTINGHSYANLLLGVKSTLITEKSHHNIVIANDPLGKSTNIINASYNKIFGAAESKIAASDEKSQSEYNTIIGGSRNNIDDSSQILMLSLRGLSAINTNSQVLMGKWNIPIENAAFIFGYGEQGNNRNLMELYPNGELKLFNSDGTKNTVTLGGDAGIQVDTLAVSTFSADYGDFNKKLYVGDQGGNGYPYKGLYVSYNSAANDTSFNISQGHGGAGLSYYTNTETLWISHSYYQDPNHSNYAAINNEYARFGYYNKEGNIGVKTSILLNGDITGPDTETKEDGTLTVYRQNEADLGLSFKFRNKVNIHASNIQFNEYNLTSNSWELVKEIGPHENNRISMDVYVFGTDATNWSTTIAGIRGGTAQQRVFLYDLFAKTPPIGYLPDDHVGTTPYVCYITNGSVGQEVNVKQIASMTQEERTAYYTALANNKSNVFNNNPFNDASIGIPTPYNYYYITRLPSNIEEIEINLYIRGFVNADSFIMMWIPTVEASTYNNIFKEPVIKMNIIRPAFTGTENIMKTKFYRNMNYLTLTGYTTEEIDTGYDTVKLMCRPYISDSTDNGYVVHYDTEAHSCCWAML